MQESSSRTARKVFDDHLKVILTPGDGFEGYFDEYEEIAPGALDEDERRKAGAELGERYGIAWRDERIPEVKARFGIKLRHRASTSRARHAPTSVKTSRTEIKEGAGMSPEQNEAVVRRYIEEVWNRHDLDAIEVLVSPDYLNHAASSAEYQRGGARRIWEWLLSVFPDHRSDIEDAAADGDTVAVRGACSGTHEGETSGIPPTGRRFAAQQSHWFRVADGKLAEHWAVRDDLGMMRQLGVIPTLGYSEKATGRSDTGS